MYKIKTLDEYVNESFVTEEERKWIVFLEEAGHLMKTDIKKFVEGANHFGFPDMAIVDALASELDKPVREAESIVKSIIGVDKSIKLSENQHTTFQDLYISKNKWIQMLKRKDRKEIANNLYVLIDNSYGPLGGHPSVKSIDDIFNSAVTHWEAIDLDLDPEADSVVFGKKTEFGIKIDGMGHDGLKASRKELIKKLVALLQKPGYWIEASDKVAELLYKSSVPYLDMKDDVVKIFPAGVEWLDNKGEYIREVSKGVKRTETVFGRPLIRN